MNKDRGCLFVYLKFLLAVIISYVIACLLEGISNIEINSDNVIYLPILIIPFTVMAFVLWIVYWFFFVALSFLLPKSTNEFVIDLCSYFISIILMSLALSGIGNVENYNYDWVDYMMDRAR